MIQPPQLRIPGPTPVPDRVQRAMAAPMINHRGPEFKALLPELEAGLRGAFKTENDLLIFPASGTGGVVRGGPNHAVPGRGGVAGGTRCFRQQLACLTDDVGARTARSTIARG